jgi:hypothetical protein
MAHSINKELPLTSPRGGSRSVAIVLSRTPPIYVHIFHVAFVYKVLRPKFCMHFLSPLRVLQLQSISIRITAIGSLANTSFSGGAKKPFGKESRPMRSHEVSRTTPLTWAYFLILLHVRGQPWNEAFGSNHKILRCNVIVISWFLFLCVVVTLSGQNVLPVACGGSQNDFVTGNGAWNSSPRSFHLNKIVPFPLQLSVPLD